MNGQDDFLWGLEITDSLTMELTAQMTVIALGVAVICFICNMAYNYLYHGASQLLTPDENKFPDLMEIARCFALMFCLSLYTPIAKTIVGTLEVINEATSLTSDRAQEFADFMEKWLEVIKSSVAVPTFASYSTSVKKIIAPYFREKEITLKNLTAKDIQEFYLKELERVSASSVIHYHANIHKALKYAVKIDLIDSNPADKVERPKKDRFIGSFYDADEVNALLQASSALWQLYDEARSLQQSIDEYKETFARQRDLSLLRKALEGGEISMIEYFVEVSVVYQSKANLLLLENQYQKVMAQMYKSRL